MCTAQRRSVQLPLGPPSGSSLCVCVCTVCVFLILDGRYSARAVGAEPQVSGGNSMRRATVVSVHEYAERNGMGDRVAQKLMQHAGIKGVPGIGIRRAGPELTRRYSYPKGIRAADLQAFFCGVRG